MRTAGARRDAEEDEEDVTDEANTEEAESSEAAGEEGAEEKLPAHVISDEEFTSVSNIVRGRCVDVSALGANLRERGAPFPPPPFPQHLQSLEPSGKIIEMNLLTMSSPPQIAASLTAQMQDRGVQ
jgi:hypothetical protein